MTTAQTTPTPAIPVLSPTPAGIPPTHELKISKDALDWLKTLSPGMFETYDQIQRTWNSPITQFSITLAQDAEFKDSFQAMRQAQVGQELIAYELVLIVLLWVLRAWRLSKLTNWFKKLLAQAWIGLVYWICSLFVIPSLVWGEPFRTFLSRLIRAIIRHFVT